MQSSSIGAKHTLSRRAFISYEKRERCDRNVTIDSFTPHIARFRGLDVTIRILLQQEA
jgi:hypothetical protein